MTRDAAQTPEKVENQRPHAEVGSHDALQPYRLDGGVTRLQSANFNVPKDGRLEIPNIWQVNATADKSGAVAFDQGARKTDFKPGNDAIPRLSPAADRPAAGSEHVVKAHDSLWKIAKESLHQAGENGASATEIAHRVKSIIHANKAEHPSLTEHANMIHPGMKLHIPGEDRQGGDHAPVQPGGHSQRTHSRHKLHDHFDQSGEKAEHAAADKAADKLHGDGVRPAKALPDNSRELKPPGDGNSDRQAPEGDGGRLAHALKKFGQDIADTAIRIAHGLGTVGDCAKGPRLTLNHYGFHLPPAVATEQGRMMQQSGMFHAVPRSEVRPGDYGVRDWNHNVTRQHGINKGDSFIVTNVGARGSLKGANDHIFNVPEDGGRYRNLQFMRPTPEFYKKYGQSNV